MALSTTLKVWTPFEEPPDLRPPLPAPPPSPGTVCACIAGSPVATSLSTFVLCDRAVAARAAEEEDKDEDVDDDDEEEEEEEE